MDVAGALFFSSESSTHQNFTDDKQCSVELDGLLYCLTEDRDNARDFPRNVINFGGRLLFPVLSLSVSASPVSLAN
jgi:hypothetical protein